MKLRSGPQNAQNLQEGSDNARIETFGSACCAFSDRLVARRASWYTPDMRCLQTGLYGAVLLLQGMTLLQLGCSSGGRRVYDAEDLDGGGGGMNSRDMRMPPSRDDMATEIPMDMAMLGDIGMSPSDMFNPNPTCVNGPGWTAFRFRFEDETGAKTDRFGLPDNSNWKVSTVYRARFADSLYGGGIEMVEHNYLRINFSLNGISAIRAAKLSIRGRSYGGLQDGSFGVHRDTYDDAETAINAFSMNPPYKWLSVSVRSLIFAGESQIMLEVFSGDDSKDIIINTVELCLDADIG